MSRNNRMCTDHFMSDRFCAGFHTAHEVVRVAAVDFVQMYCGVFEVFVFNETELVVQCSPVFTAQKFGDRFSV